MTILIKIKSYLLSSTWIDINVLYYKFKNEV